MHDNRNKEVIKRVEKGMMKANRTRNTFAIVAVALTTFMITTVFSLGINYKENMELTSVRTSGTNANVSLAMPTNAQEKEIRDLDYVKMVGTQYMIGSVAGKNEADRDLAIAMQYYDNTEWEKHYKEAISNINGNYPKKENEIMLSEDALSQLGIKKPKLDMEIPLSYVSKDGEQKDTFTLSGWFRSYTGTGMAFLSESYCQEHGYTLQNSGVLSISLDNPKNNFYDIQDDITLNENQTFQGSVSMSSSNGSVYAMIILLVFFIIGSGYLLIYNVLYISISRDTRFYGLIKTLGTTEKQIKTLVKRQAVTFACIGIPIGVILAGALSFGIVPIILENAFDSGKSIIDAEVFFHPSIFILSIIFSALTVWISCNAPAKAAILVIVLFATLANADDWVEIALFAEDYQDYLRKYIELKNGSPSHDTIRRVMGMISPEILQQLYAKWQERLNRNDGELLKKIICIDGKTMCANKRKEEKASHIVSAWSKEDGVCLGQKAVEEKSNEITAIPELLEKIQIKDQVITIDAMGTQKGIAEKIRRKCADYVLALKGNQGTMYEEVKEYFKEKRFLKEIQEKGCYKKTQEKAHSQIETREYYQTEDIVWMAQKKEWKGLKSIVMEKKTLETDGIEKEEYRYFISSLREDIELISRAVRGHWSIESMHRHLDVTFREDANTTIDKIAAQNQNIIRKWSLSILKTAEGSRHKLSMRKKRYVIGLRPMKHLEEVLNS